MAVAEAMEDTEVGPITITQTTITVVVTNIISVTEQKTSGFVILCTIYAYLLA